jgi:hypothetical protein
MRLTTSALYVRKNGYMKQVLAVWVGYNFIDEKTKKLIRGVKNETLKGNNI